MPTVQEHQALKSRIVIKMEIRQVYLKCFETLSQLITDQNQRMTKVLSGSTKDKNYEEMSKKIKKFEQNTMSTFTDFKNKVDKEINDYGMEELTKVQQSVRQFDYEREELMRVRSNMFWK